jgi:tetratricopeptide (TPR) repeat protein
MRGVITPVGAVTPTPKSCSTQSRVSSAFNPQRRTRDRLPPHRLLYRVHVMRLLRVPKSCFIFATIASYLQLSALGQTIVLPAGPPPHAPAMQTIPIAAAANASYAAESFVIEHLDTVFTFAADGTGFNVRTVAIRIQSEAAVRSLGVVSIPYAGNSEQVEILYARVRRPDGTVIETDTTGTLDMPEPVTREAPFYSDLKEKQLPIRSLRVGDTLEWKARVTRTKAEAPGEFWGAETFSDSAVSLAETFELRVPASVSLNVWSSTAKADESTSAGEHIYRWTSSQLKPTAGKEADAATEAKKKIVWTAEQELDADQGKLPDVAWTTFKSWEEVGAWYRNLEGDRATPSPEIKSKVAELIAGKSTDEDKVRALYAYVATQIRYIGVDFGIGRYQPHTASEILGNQYGDCKDKHTLLAAMLSAAGIQSDAVLIGAGIRFNPVVPSPAAFNHLITHLTLAGQPVWLDTTAEIAPYRMLVSVIRDKQALVVPVSGVAHLDRTPAELPFASFQTMDAIGTLDKDGVSHSRLTFVVRGDHELAVRSAFQQTSPGQYNQVVQQLSYGIGYGGTTTNPDVTRPEDTAEPFKMSYDYEREKAGDWDNYKIIPQVAPVGLPRFGDTDPLVRNLDLDTPRVETSRSAIKIPDGWTAILPEAAHYKCPYATYDETYRFESGTVYTERRIEVLKQKVPTADLKTYKKWANDASLGDELYIQLIKHDPGTSIHLGSTSKSDAPGGGATPTAKPAATPTGEVSTPGTDPVKLIYSATTFAQQGDFDTAAERLDQAKAIDPERSGLWGMYGAIAMQRGKVLDAVDDYLKEIKFHPEQYSAYPALVEAQMRLAERKEAMDTLRAWATADVSNPSPATQLITMQLAEGDAKAAIVTAETALTHLPNDPKKNAAIEFGLGRAEIIAGSVAKGTARIHTVLKYAEEPSDLNAGAHALADAALDLPLAESSARTAMDKLTEESITWTLDENPLILQRRSELLLDTWATLGWVLLRERKFDEAGSYLNAAWLGDLNAETGEHLGDLALARQEKRTAMAEYELAMAKAPSYDGMGARRPPGPLEKQLQKHIDALLNAGVMSTVGTQDDPYRKLESLRTIPLGTFNGLNGRASYRILLKDGKVAKVEELPNEEIQGGSDMVSKAKLPVLWPAGSHATLIRYGFIDCHSGDCGLILQP